MVEQKDDVMRISLARDVDESYDLVFGEGLFPKIASDLKETPIGSRYAIVTDSNVGELFAKELEDALMSEGLQVQTFSFEAGEKSKTVDSCMKVIGEMSGSGYGRDSAILALGGGVVGDMAGFMAVIFNRGIPYIQIPTTVLAQADSSIGGKTGVDTEFGKNLVGAFKQPWRVYLDVAVLKNLPDREYRAGLAETIKHGIIFDGNFFRYLQENIESVLGKIPESLIRIAKNNCKIKGAVVESDPHEVGLRKILNYGHTAGHAVELLSNYELSHGEAISIGMMVAGRIANKLGHFSKEDLDAQEGLLIAAGFPTKIPNAISNEDIIKVTATDKKAVGGKAMYSLPVSIGKMHDFDGKYATYVDDEVVMAALQSSR